MKTISQSTEGGHCSFSSKDLDPQRLIDTGNHPQGQDAESNPSDALSGTLNMKPLIPLASPRSICFYFCLSPTFFQSYLKGEDEIQIYTSLNHLFSLEVLCFLTYTSSRALCVWEEIPRALDSPPLSGSLWLPC